MSPKTNVKAQPATPAAAVSTGAVDTSEFVNAVGIQVEDADRINRELMSFLASTAKDWVEEQTGFPPYWTPSSSPGFVGTVIGLDPAANEKDFNRWIIAAVGAPVVCQKGPADDAALIEVAPGEMFTMSDYAALNLTPYIGQTILLVPRQKRSLGGGKDLWDWTLKVSKETKAAVLARLQEARKAQQTAMLEQSMNLTSVDKG
jgi:hypothetical protein